MRLLLTLLVAASMAASSLWSATCVSLICKMDGTKTTGPVSLRIWTWGDGTKADTTRDKIKYHTFTKAGTYSVRQTVYDSVVKKWYYKSLNVTVKAPVPAAVDTVRIAYPVHDTIRVKSPPDTVRIQLPPKHDTVAVTMSVPPLFLSGGVLVDSTGNQAWRVYQLTWLGTINRRDGKYQAYPAARAVTPASGAITLYITAPLAGVFTTLDSAVKRAVP